MMHDDQHYVMAYVDSKTRHRHMDFPLNPGILVAKAAGIVKAAKTGVTVVARATIPTALYIRSFTIVFNHDKVIIQVLNPDQKYKLRLFGNLCRDRIKILPLGANQANDCPIHSWQVP